MNTRTKDHPLRSLILAKHTKEEIEVQSVVTPSMQKVSSVLSGSSSARPLTKMVILPSCGTKHNHLLSLETSSHINCKWDVFTCKKIQDAASQVM